ncbi:GNAT family N-acetyltransferase [Ancylomarina euxinus]|uniref:GNAT family N-acetyltransferase n=1 Tax=Ancylomarina euxinus TaxID=2283627 RepID=A0A425XXS6_9BACT|nr:GNAT family N-acetyltransferase [Ancylomarina euxinus]MCZ4696040.1 GNAT family N-acetyltransferase [Ancylomarina euxinus]MUP13979.1 GNAT family N-acetyltransferase [Ancylomarina euxinus]RRG19533.1 GNAT family N-acetyltransferase [Ancylomarina euxinus]
MKKMLVYRDITFKEILLIKELWERNRDYHQQISKSFGNLYKELIFEDRMIGFAGLDKDRIKMTLVEDVLSDESVAYCISVRNEMCGEVQTLHVIEEYRGCGIGKSLMLDHMMWFKKNDCNDVKLNVSCENKNTIAFYEALGFRSNTIEMCLMSPES